MKKGRRFALPCLKQNNMEVLFLNPPYLKRFSRSQRSPAVTRSGTLYYPLWLAHAAGNTELHGHEINLIDAPANGSNIGEIVSRVRRAPGLLVLETSTPSIENDLQIVDSIRDAWSDTHVCLVGPHVSALPEESLAACKADSVAMGEYDDTVADLADILSDRGDISTVSGLAWKDGPHINHNESRPLIEDLDRLPFVSRVYRRFLDFRNYFNPNALSPMVTIVTSRGCPYGCSFCVYPYTMTGKRQRLRSVGNVVDEMEEIRDSFPGVRGVFFEDDTLTANRAHTRMLCEEIMRRGLRLRWTANARADVDLETLKLMRSARLRCLCVGFESGAASMLDQMQKRLDVDSARRFMNDARLAGVLIHGCFIVGMPGETEETMQETLRLALELNPDTAQFYPLMIYPGTPAYDEIKNASLLVAERFSQWLTPDGHHTAVAGTGSLSPDELIRFCAVARRRFYLRPRYLGKKLAQALGDDGERVRLLRGAKTFWRHLIAP